jgi:hypothetical protein
MREWSRSTRGGVLSGQVNGGMTVSKAQEIKTHRVDALRLRLHRASCQHAMPEAAPQHAIPAKT